MSRKRAVPPNEEYLEARLDLTANLLASAMIEGDDEAIKRNLFRLTSVGLELDKMRRQDRSGNPYIL